MNKSEVVKGIESIIDGLNRIQTALMESEEAKDTIKGNMNEPEVVPVDVSDLDKMGYNEFKKYAASLGVKCTGTREQIMSRVLKALDSEEGSGVDDEESKSDSDTTSEGVSDSENVDSDDESGDEFDEQAEEIAKTTDVEDIIEALSDSGVKANKKNYVEKLAYALREGLIELDDDEDSEQESADDEDDSTDDGDVDFEPTSYFPEYDFGNLNDPDEMSKKRAKAVEEKMNDIITSVDNGTLKFKEIREYIEDSVTDKEKASIQDDDAELLKFYMELVKATIDEDGEEHEPSDPYEIGEENVCCGHVLKYSKGTKKYICEICGSEYEADE